MKVKWLAAAAAVVIGLATGTAQAEWYQASSKHFVVYSDDSLANVKDYTARLERFAAAVRVLHGTPDVDRGPASRVTVFVVPTVGDVEKLRQGAAGFWIGRIAPVAVMPRKTGEASSYGMTAQAILFHEFTHHWMLTSWSDAAFPTWYVEGAAEFHATAQLLPNGDVMFGATPTWRQWGVGTALQDYMPAHDLVRVTPDKLNPKELEALYGRGWLLTDYLTVTPEGRKRLADYVGAINAGKGIGDSAKLLGDVDDLTLDAYARRPRFPSLIVPADKLKIGDIAVRPLSPGEAAIMPTTIHSKSGVTRATAPQVLAQARAVAARMPDDPAVNNEVAEAEYDVASFSPPGQAADGYARAAAAADRAIAADPKSVHALLYKGMALEAIATEAKKTDAATWTEVRRWYLAANRADTENADPLIHYYDTFRVAKQTPTAGAEKGVLYAYALAPYAGETRLDATKVLLSQGKVAEAHTALAPLAYGGDGGGGELGKVLAAMDKDGASGGLAAIKALEDKADAEREKARKKG